MNKLLAKDIIMKKSKKKYIHVRLDVDLEPAFTIISEEHGRLSEIVNSSIRNWYLENKEQIRLRNRIRIVAESMEGFAYEKDGFKIPHSVFVEWDQTWTVAEELHITTMSSNDDIKAAIRSQEISHEDYYSEEINEYKRKCLIDFIKARQ